jgi:putative lipoprotein
MALPPDASIDVRLEDATLADAPAKVVAENTFSAAGKQVPIPYQLPYSPQDIQQSHRYYVRARILAGEKLLFTTTQSYPVLTNGAPNQADLTLEPVGQTPTQPASAANTLRGTTWKLIELHGKPVEGTNPNNPAFILFDADQKRYSGSSGCNRITGTFQLSGDSLQLLGGAMTMMACPEPLMKLEQEFNEALTATGSYRISGNVLELLERKKVVAKFEAATAQPNGQ